MSPQAFKEDSQPEELSWIRDPDEETVVRQSVQALSNTQQNDPNGPCCGWRNQASSLFHSSYFLQQFSQAGRHYSGHADCILCTLMVLISGDGKHECLASQKRKKCNIDNNAQRPKHLGWKIYWNRLTFMM